MKRHLGLVRSSPRNPAAFWLVLAGGAALAYYFLKDTASGVVTAVFRTPQDILNAVARIDPERTPELQPEDGLTWCNKAALLFAKALGVPLLSGLANAQYAWLDAGNEGWYPAGSASAAQAAALEGKVVFASWYNFGGHGHIALVLPIAGPTVMIAQAGKTNYNEAPLSWGFGSKRPSFYVHD